MRISFDLDDTLVCYDPNVPREPNRAPFWARPWFDEPLRLGTRDLLRELTARGHDVCIYTTSFRDPKSLKKWFGFHGIKIVSVINQELHDKVVRRDRTPFFVSKFPPAFDLDLHVDDQDDLRVAGEKLGFVVLSIMPNDLGWTTRVLQAVERLDQLKNGITTSR